MKYMYCWKERKLQVIHPSFETLIIGRNMATIDFLSYATYGAKISKSLKGT